MTYEHNAAKLPTENRVTDIFSANNQDTTVMSMGVILVTLLLTLKVYFHAGFSRAFIADLLVF